MGGPQGNPQYVGNFAQSDAYPTGGLAGVAQQSFNPSTQFAQPQQQLYLHHP